ncbi:prokaryotic cytochrome C oxidase subunit IV family protein [Mycobacterium sp. PS03-16]|uniref:cytochrome C oxidase subunit IV family protein n=1 Tax=Mycobacterium sp. PS03-16 TaxID=2559611 RepID=UPI001073AD8C|nr:cytochrome C oxidase subunit IV family protein [Mycobacterium sp. PS03-16]TFV59733.1 prokaryotic cytochrome C oxidase subunit IV family protein [Mycobacterium sp. PS03-16]
MTAPDRTTAPDRAVTYAWLVLCTITVLSWWLAPAPADRAAGAGIPITLAVIAMAAVKGRLIIRYFMEVRAAPCWLQRATDAWLIALWAAVLGIYLW